MKVLIFLSIVALSFLTSPAIRTTSFTVDYIHRDSPLSPYHNSSRTRYERLHATILRNTAALRRHSRSQDLDIESKVFPNNGDFLMSISMGTPPLEILAIADTGSDLIWTNCKPCKNCYTQNAPLFDPKHSSTFQEVLCDSEICHHNDDVGCNRYNQCSYSYDYSDGSGTEGAIISETLTFSSSNGGKVSIPNINVGCSHHTEGEFQSNVAGIIGLGDGPLSLISQLGSKIDNKFSYCLLPDTVQKSSSKFTFGQNDNAAYSAAMKIPLRPSYHLQLKSLSVGGTYMDMPAGDGGDGNVLIDSGTTLSFLPSSVFRKLSSAISRMTSLEPATDPSGQLKSCYNVGEGTWGDGLPDINLNFENGVAMTLPPMNMFTEVSKSIVCLAVYPYERDWILGNIAQQNFLIEFDLGEHVLSIAPTDCTQ